MGRISQGWKLRQRAPGHAYAVRFWIRGREFERSTGTSEEAAAAIEAARIYADAVQREPPERRVRVSGGIDPEEVVAAWLLHLASTHDEGTCDTWELYAMTHWLPHFEAMHNFTDAMADAYMRKRLGSVQGVTVRKELTALRQFCAWAFSAGFLPREVTCPSVPKRAIGTRFSKRRRVGAFDLSPDECEAMLAALPEWSTSRKVARFPIRARFMVGYETGLRPSALDSLEAGVHYRKGSASILVTPELDKNRWGRELPLSVEARAALDAVCPTEGLIFGKHDYREHVKAAAALALPAERAERFCAAHLRSAMVTHKLEATGNLPGVQYLAGHKLATTTAGYAKASLRAAMDVIRSTEPQGKAKKAKRRG
jgi:integrase